MIPRLIPRPPPPLLLAAALLTLAAGCKPKAAPADGGTLSTPSSDRSSKATTGDTAHRPTAGEVTGFLRSVTPALVHVTEVKMDPPVQMPNTSPADHAWVFNLKVTLAAAEDLFGAPSPADTQAFTGVLDDLGEVMRWHDAFIHSPYARFYPDFDIKPPAGPTPRLLARLHKAGETLPPVYGRMEAVWQVDHWNFAQELPEPRDPGQPRSAFAGPRVVQGSPEAQAFLTVARAALAQARGAQAALNARYAADVVKATLPGTVYRGQLSYHGAVTPAEVRFGEGTNPDPQYTPFELHLPAMPSYVFTYSAKLARQLPLHPAPPVGADGDPTPTPTPADAEPAPKGDLTVSFVGATGKLGRLDDTVPVQLLEIVRQFGAPSNVTLSVLDHHLQGRLNGYVTDNVGFVLSAQQTP